MNSFRTEPIVLSGEQFMKLADSLRRPDKEYLDRRDAVFTKMDEDISIRRDGTNIEVEIPDLDLSFIDEMSDNNSNICTSTIELSGEFSYVVNVDNVQNVISALAESMLRTVKNTVVDCADSIGQIAMRQYVYNQMGVDKSMIYIEDNDGDRLMQPCKTEQISYAA